ncbi:alpha-N-arabinofuranosidase [Phytoactinopolyspora alkaliphila]|uniref:non-reducing end alpha-L-arabinofuranosidase n=1 Tax=Phytoactinopolyspora alkaliphila TaxID=1783498 RepID=A0A6N9YK84_9ACTN|nr:alpha-N-arabinofuranosidase [Phytoactinopolyspora alkaliphila]NED95320.1 alpha-N-arabinofuranosidase [Phytoactinopolyspora alkaliphila]
MTTATIVLDPAFRVAPVNRRTFGTFVEHLGRCVYTGIFEPGHPKADDDGFREDVLALVRELGVSTVRYPGGNFVSGYRWEDGVGPLESRPRRLDLAWKSIETNEFGLNEFMRWTRKAGLEPMMALNLGTRGVQEALDLLEYATHPSGTHLSELRREHGEKDPHDIGLWCLGNELDGPWQIGHKTAHEYGRLAAESARAMKMVKPDLELVACGSSSSGMPTFGSWEAEVLEEAFEYVDHISCHAYYQETDGDLGSFLASAVNMDHFIGSVAATADHVAAKRKSDKRIGISFDEWNVWYQSHMHEAGPRDEWEIAPRLIEDEYNAADAVVVGSLLISLLRNTDRVAVACQAQLVNAIAPIRSEPGGAAWRQTIFHPFALTSRMAAGEVLRAEITAPSVQTAKYGEVPAVDAVATYDEASGDVAVFMVNRHTGSDITVELDARAFGSGSVDEAVGIYEADVYSTNTEAEPERVVPKPNTSVRLDGGKLRAVLPKASWTAVKLSART